MELKNSACLRSFGLSEVFLQAELVSHVGDPLLLLLILLRQLVLLLLRHLQLDHFFALFAHLGALLLDELDLAGQLDLRLPQVVQTFLLHLD